MQVSDFQATVKPSQRSSRCTWFVFGALFVLFLVLTALVILFSATPCLSSSFCIQWLPAEKSVESRSTIGPKHTTHTERKQTSMASTEMPTTFPMQYLTDNNSKAACWQKYGGVCFHEDGECPFTTQNFNLTVCGKGHACCYPKSRGKMNLPARPNCGLAPLGRTSFRIVNGWTTVAWPWIVSILKNGSHICGGTIISATTIASAAHCFKNTSAEEITIVTGQFNLQKSEISEKAFAVDKIIENSFNHTTSENDIALLIIEGKIEMGANRQPACLPVSEDNFISSDVCIALGWGKGSGPAPITNILQMVALPIIATARCEKMHGIVRDNSKIVHPQKNICTLMDLTDTCQGDSGGPLLCKREGHMVLAGIVSWGPKICAQKNQPGVYTNVTYFMPWIQENVKDLPPNA